MRRSTYYFHMDRKLSGSLMHCAVFLLVLGLRCSPVFPAHLPPSVSATCAHLKRTVHLAEVFAYEANELLHLSVEKHGNKRKSVPDEVPNSQISGVDITEKLRDICTKSKLFKLHVAHAESYQKELLLESEAVSQTLVSIQTRLGYLTAEIKTIVGAESSAPTTPAPLQLTHDDVYTKKAYAVGVAVRLRDWSTQVVEVVKEAKKAC